MQGGVVQSGVSQTSNSPLPAVSPGGVGTPGFVLAPQLGVEHLAASRNEAPLGSLGLPGMAQVTPAAESGPAQHARNSDSYTPQTTAIPAQYAQAASEQAPAMQAVAATEFVSADVPLADDTLDAPDVAPSATLQVADATFVGGQLVSPAAAPVAALLVATAAPPLGPVAQLSPDPLLGEQTVPGWVPNGGDSVLEPTTFVAAVRSEPAATQVAAAFPPSAAPAADTQASLWPQISAACFTDVGWVEEGLAIVTAGESSGQGETSGLHAALAAGLAVVMAGSWEQQARKAYEGNRKPGLRSRP
jgi:hypothetical protein